MKVLIRQYSAPSVVIERTYQCIKTTRMKDFGRPKFSSLSDRIFNFTIKDSKAEIRFSSPRLLEFYNKLNDRLFFKKLLEASSIYGIDRGFPGGKNRGSEQKVNRYQGVVIIFEYGEGAEGESLIFVNDLK